MSLITNLVSYYKCDEASGNLLDSHGSAHMTETSGTIAAGTGILSGCRDLEAGDTEYFELADPYYHQDLTISIWTNVESFGANRVLISKGSLTEWQINYQTTDSRLRFSAIDTAARSAVANNFGAPSTGVWLHIVAWYSMATDIVGIRVNGGTANTVSTLTGTLADTASPIRVGCRSDTTQFWDGLVDEIGIWSRVLTTDEQDQLYNAGTGLAYPFSRGRRKYWYLRQLLSPQIG